VSNYTLEVSSPGIARSLRTLEQFQHYLGSVISLKTRPGFEGPRRVQGRLMETNETEVSLKTNNRIVTFPYDWIETARTVVDWQMPDDDNTPNSDNEVVL
jgi:ribosome maturation factor RimP